MNDRLEEIKREFASEEQLTPEDEGWLIAEVERLRAAIKRVLEDEESRPGGWGPDVTMVQVLREALEKKP